MGLFGTFVPSLHEIALNSASFILILASLFDHFADLDNPVICKRDPLARISCTFEIEERFRSWQSCSLIAYDGETYGEPRTVEVNELWSVKALISPHLSGSVIEYLPCLHCPNPAKQCVDH